MPEKKFLLVEGNKKSEVGGADFPYGLAHGYVESLIPVTTTIALPSTELTLVTPIIPAGNYRIDWSYIWQVADNNSSTLVNIVVDGFLKWAVQAPPTDKDSPQSSAGFLVMALAAAAHTIELQHAHIGGTDSTILDRRIAIERWD